MKNKYLYFILLLNVFYQAFFISHSYSDDKIDISFKFIAYLGGLKIGQADGKFTINNNTYIFEYNAKSSGLISLIYKWKQYLKAEGIVTKSDIPLNSTSYYSSDIRGEKMGHMNISYGKNIVEVISAKPNPKDDDRRNSISNELRKNTFDPASAFISLGFNIKKYDSCTAIVPIFDGRRRYNIKSTDGGIEILKSTKIKQIEGIVKRCNIQFERIDGYTKKELAKHPTDGHILYKKYENINLFFPVKVTLSSKYGSFVGYLFEN